jgi:hypothetical protein
MQTIFDRWAKRRNGAIPPELIARCAPTRTEGPNYAALPSRNLEVTPTKFQSELGYRHLLTASVVFEIIPCGKLSQAPVSDYAFSLCVKPLNLGLPIFSKPDALPYPRRSPSPSRVPHAPHHIKTRLSGGRYILSPSFTPNAS